jgi:nigerose phosphorylase
MNWTISERGSPDQAAIDRLGSEFVSGNGSIGLRGTLDEYGGERKTATVINGLYDQVGKGWREPVNAPNGLLFRVSSSGIPLDAVGSKPVAHVQSLDFRHSVQSRETVFSVGEARLTLSSRRFVSAVSERLICAEYVLEADGRIPLEVSSGIDGGVWDLNGPHLGNFTATRRDGVIALASLTSESAIPVSVAETTTSPGLEPVTAEGSALRVFSFVAEPNRRYVFEKFVVVLDGRGNPDAAACAPASVAECQKAASLGFDHWQDKQGETWDARWDECDVEIEGDDEAQLALRFSIYHLLAIAPFLSGSLSIPARGLSGQMYRGAIFWDTEIFMLPFFQNSFPAVARAILAYRSATLPGARAKAAEYGYRGAFYAWESQDGGRDACTLFNVNDVFTGRPIRTFFRDRQIHISADVAFAFRGYWRATGDLGPLLSGGAAVLYECARFLASWIYYKPEKDRYEVLDVTGPDEYHERVHNAFFTNRLVARAFGACLEADEILRTSMPEERKALVGNLDVETELERFRDILEKLYVPDPDPETLIIPQFDGYLDLEECGVGELLSRKKMENEYLGGGNGLARWTRIIKQADVVLGLALIDGDWPFAVRKANWDFYDRRTEHGSSLSACTYSILASSIGETESAYRYFMKTATIDLTGDAKQYVGDLYIGGTHPAANGGAWLATFRGFCGISVADGTISIRPALPEGWRSVSLAIRCGAETARARISPGRVELEAARPFSSPITVDSSTGGIPWDGKEKLVLASGGREARDAR